jgi:hypothetical protein
LLEQSKNFEKISKSYLELTMKKVMNESTNKIDLKFDDLDQKNFKVQSVVSDIHLKIIRGEVGEGKSHWIKNRFNFLEGIEKTKNITRRTEIERIKLVKHMREQSKHALNDASK